MTVVVPFVCYFGLGVECATLEDRDGGRRGGLGLKCASRHCGRRCAIGVEYAIVSKLGVVAKVMALEFCTIPALVAELVTVP